MTITDAHIPLADVQHLVLFHAGWQLYEHLLAEIGDRPLRVTYCDGGIEIMSPLPKHEKWKARIGRLIETLAMERGIPIEPLGSTTFRRADRAKGLEPDECYYVRHAGAARDIEEGFDPLIHPPPDLAIEIDVTRRSLDREPVYAALGVPEIWRFDGQHLEVRQLGPGGSYQSSGTSLAFPFLPVTDFCRYVHRLAVEPQVPLLEEFRNWARGLSA